MGSRKKAKGKKQVPKKKHTAAKKPPGKKTTPAARPLRTQFMDDFIRALIFDASQSGDARFLWPAQGTGQDEALSQFADAAEVLGAQMTGPPPVGSGSNPPTFRDRIITFLTDLNWPDASPVPPKFGGKTISPRTVHLVEIAVICDRLLEAVNDGRGGGGGGKWPPH